jgi:hypothetical protein
MSHLTTASSGFIVLAIAGLVGLGADAHAQSAIKPTVMVMPSTMYMKERGFCTPVDIDGKQLDDCDYEQMLSQDKTFATIVATIASQFQNRGYPIADLETSLKNIKAEAALRMAKGKVEQTMTDMLLRSASPDIALEVKSDITNQMGQNRITLILSATDVYVSQPVATPAPMSSNPSGSIPVPELAQAVVLAMMPELESRLMAHFERMAVEGRRVRLRFEITEAAGLSDGMETEVQVNGEALPVAIYAEQLVKEMAVNGQFQPGPTGDTFADFNSFNMPFAESPRLYAFKIASRMKKETGLNAKASTGRGLGDLLILIDAPSGR